MELPKSTMGMPMDRYQWKLSYHHSYVQFCLRATTSYQKLSVWDHYSHTQLKPTRSADGTAQRRTTSLSHLHKVLAFMHAALSCLLGFRENFGMARSINSIMNVCERELIKTRRLDKYWTRDIGKKYWHRDSQVDVSLLFSTRRFQVEATVPQLRVTWPFQLLKVFHFFEFD